MWTQHSLIPDLCLDSMLKKNTIYTELTISNNRLVLIRANFQDGVLWLLEADGGWVITTTRTAGSWGSTETQVVRAVSVIHYITVNVWKVWAYTKGRVYLIHAANWTIASMVVKKSFWSMDTKENHSLISQTFWVEDKVTSCLYSVLAAGHGSGSVCGVR